ncbi:hypothetical protein [Allonocardiopsis opalescens]|uniref:DUF5668 domain-containing protein n=1 Tax=Allonocardiopsis opalescens TaxID=1144618 RepID=A0A2T0Q8G8_9ACTN|nr:hypothetical protein [Allonocardiopsis opalescens]PRY00072.1 hypothetical protein CLV72_103682 [Allonocardiopsis opalescens]
MSRRRPDYGSLLAGLLFLGLGVAVLLQNRGTVQVEPLWLVVALLIGLGAAGLARAMSWRPKDD